jgi:hypothetical protein
MASPIQRLNYHTGLFLEEAEFQLEQNYHLGMRQRINYAIFKPGVLYGMALDYTGGVLKVTAGMAIDETNDPDFGPIGRELLLLQDSDPVSLSGFNPGNTAWMTIEYDSSLDAPKAPTNIAARYTQKVKISALHANPGPGTNKILLGQIVIGTNSVNDAVQKASLRMTGAPLPVPTITNFAPISGGAGTPVVITGTNFAGATAVAFGGVAATVFTVNSATQITATVPAGAATGKIRVTTPAGFGESAANFTVPAAALPTVANFAPLSGGAATPVVITGTNFAGATGVAFGGVAATVFTVNSATQIAATVPAGAATGRIRVTTPAGFGDSAADFTVIPAPAVTTVVPPSGSPGASVVITGTTFSGATAVAFGGVPATVFTVNSATQITATVPAGAVTGKVRVTTSGGFGESAADFTVVPAPVIKSILPTAQAVGGTLAVRGSDIRSGALAPGAPAAGTTIRFVDPVNAGNFVNAATGTVQTDVAPATGPQRVQVIVPAKGALPNLVDITLEINGVSATSPQQFTFV